ncbi:MAG: diphthine synthase [Conexivisphaerales archaeon]
MTLGLVGLGVQGMASVPMGGLKYLKECDIIYADMYTSPWPPDLLHDLSSELGKNIQRASRTLLEDGRKILDEAKQAAVAVITVGDPFLATTHIILKQRAKEMGIPVRIFYSSSIINAIFGETGLHIYKLGKIITAVRNDKVVEDSLYPEVKDNLTRNRHTLFLLEYDSDSGEYLAPSELLAKLRRMEENYKLGVFKDDRLVIVASRVGWSSQMICAGRLKDMMTKNFGEPPHSVIIPSELHYTEADALATLAEVDKNILEQSNTKLEPPHATLVNKAIHKTMMALEKGRRIAKEKGIDNLDDVFENVECYLSDAQRFLLDGKPELALIQAGYAEGLLDSLRFQKILNFEW